MPLLLLVAGVPLAGVRALSGPPLAALALAGLACVAAGSGLRLGGPLFLPLAFGVLVAAAGRSHVQVGPEGDEPHYLMVADSLLRDGDLALERDYAEGRYAAFHDAPLAPHYRVRGKGGEIYSLHAVGLSILILPAWAVAGYAGVTVFMALLATLLAREVREWVSDLTGNLRLAEAAGWLAALSPPLVHYAGLVFTEVPAALALSLGLRLARRRDARRARGARRRLRRGGADVAQRALRAARGRDRRPRALAAPSRRARSCPCSSRARCPPRACSLYHQALYGFWDPRRVYGRRPEFSLSTLAEGLPGLLLDQEFGLLVYAPVLVLAVPGFVRLVRRDRGLALAAGAAVAAVVLTAGTWHMWRGGFNPPARFLVPIAPLLVVAVALVVGEARPDRGRGAARRLEALHGPRGRVGAAPRPPRPGRHGAPLPRAVGRARVDGPAAGLRAVGPGPASPRGGVGPGPAGGRAVADATGECASPRRRQPGAGAGRAGRRRGLAPAHGRSGRGAARRPLGHSACRAGAWALCGRALGSASRSTGVRSTSRTGTRRAPRSAGA